MRPPGSDLIRLIALLVPWPRRAEWLAEWQAELAYAMERRDAGGGVTWLTVLTLRLRCLGAIADALWLRRRHGGGDMLGSDVRIGLRALVRRPGFSAVIVLTIALGIGGSTAIFSVVDPLLLRPLPYPHAHRLAELWSRTTQGHVYPGMELATWEAIREALPPAVFDRVEAGSHRNVVVTGAGEPDELRVSELTPGALEVLGARAVAGRLFGADDAAPDAPDVVVLGETFWRQALGGDAGAIGATILLNDRPVTVIGVLPASFKYPLGTVSLWRPLRTNDPLWPVRAITPLLRLREGVPAEAAQAHLDGIAARLEAESPQRAGWQSSVRLLEQGQASNLDGALRLLMAAVACALLIACVNAANLLLVRGATRQSELAVRSALGATRWRLFRQLLTESLILSLAGGAIGVLVAWWGVRALTGILPETLTLFTQVSIGIDARVLGFTLAATVITGLVFGAGPALIAARRSLAGAVDRRATASSVARRAGGALVVVELALAMMLLVGAGLLVRSFVALTAVNAGFETRGMVTMQLMLPGHRYPDGDSRQAFYDVLRERLAGLPGVRAVTVSGGLPPQAGGIEMPAFYETGEGVRRPLDGLMVASTSADPGFFDVLGIPIVAGRGFTREDARPPDTSNPSTIRPSSTSVIIDPDLAAFLWPGQSPLGRRFRRGESDSPWLTVIGVAGDVKMLGPDDRRFPFELYYATDRHRGTYAAVGVRAPGDPAALIARIRETVRLIDPDQPVWSIATAESRMRDAVEHPRFVLTLMSLFTAFAVLLAAIGVYGISAYLVAQRTREIGVRIALGATRRDVLATVFGRSLALAALGAAIGLAAALALGRFIRSLLFGVGPTDPIALVAVTVLLGLVALMATLPPALRAIRVDPIDTLRVE